MTRALTKKQQAVLGYIKSFSREKGFPPTRAEIANHFGFKSANAAEDHLCALACKGEIVLTRSASRGITLVEDINKPARDEMERALKVILTWASVDGALVPEHVRLLCNKALRREAA